MKSFVQIILFTIFLIKGSFIPAFSQGITMEETLEYINRKLAPHSKVDVLRGVIVSQYFDAGTLVREDQALCKSLDINTIKYDPENRILSINCASNQKCVDRQLFVRKIQRDYNRLSFPVTLDAKSTEGMRKAITHMIKLVLDTKYESFDPFE